MFKSFYLLPKVRHSDFRYVQQIEDSPVSRSITLYFTERYFTMGSKYPFYVLLILGLIDLNLMPARSLKKSVWPWFGKSKSFSHLFGEWIFDNLIPLWPGILALQSVCGQSVIRVILHCYPDWISDCDHFDHKWHFQKLRCWWRMLETVCVGDKLMLWFRH